MEGFLPMLQRKKRDGAKNTLLLFGERKKMEPGLRIVCKDSEERRTVKWEVRLDFQTPHIIY